MNQGVNNSRPLTKLELEDKLRPIFNCIEQEKASQVFGWGNWMGRHMKVIKTLPKQNKWELAQVVGVTIGVTASVAMLGIGAFANLVTVRFGSYEEMKDGGHGSEWGGEAILLMGYIGKTIQVFQIKEKVNQVDQIYRKYMDPNKLSPEELNLLNEYRIDDIKNLESFCTFSEKPFLPLKSPIIYPKEDQELNAIVVDN